MRKGFTLVELSIVLVIIGLLVAGVIVGRDLVRNAQIRSLVSQQEEYVTAIRTYQGKYNALPGDHDKASVYFGALSGNCFNTISTNDTTCSGDGDGFIEYTASSSVNREGFRFWEHLALAGLYSGPYTGVQGVLNTTDHIPGLNAPTTDIEGVSFAIWHLSELATNLSYFPDFANKHVFRVGIAVDLPNPTGQFLTVSEMQGLDLKYDDGSPDSGWIQSTIEADCVDSLGGGRFGYEPDNSDDLACALYFDIGSLN